MKKSFALFATVLAAVLNAATPSTSLVYVDTTARTLTGNIVAGNNTTISASGTGTITATAAPVSGLTGLGTGVSTFLATPSSANLASAVTGETGSGALVFATSPTLVTPVLGAATGTSLSLSGSLAVSGAVDLQNLTAGTFGSALPASASVHVGWLGDAAPLNPAGVNGSAVLASRNTPGAEVVLATQDTVRVRVGSSGTTLAGALTVSGAGTIAGLTLSGGSFAAGSLYKSASLGTVLSGATGSSYDLFITNPAGSYIIQTPTGTRGIEVAGNISTVSNLTVGGTVNSGALTSSFYDAVSSFTRTGLNGVGAAGVLSVATDGKTAGDAMMVSIQGKDSANNTQTYGQIKATIVDPTSTSEDSTFAIQTVTAGSLADAVVISQSDATFAGNVLVNAGFAEITKTGTDLFLSTTAAGRGITFRTGAYANALTLDSSQNATFNGTTKITNGNLQVYGYNGNSALAAIFLNADQSSYIYNDNTHINFRAGGVDGLKLASGTGNATFAGNIKLSAYGAGTLTTDSSGNVTATSDERAKNITGTFTKGLAEVVKLTPKTYTWKQETGLNTTDIVASLTAQDLIAAGIPEAVNTYRTVADVDEDGNQKVDADGKPLTKRIDATYTVSDRTVIAALVNAVKELNAKVAALEAARN